MLRYSCEELQGDIERDGEIQVWRNIGRFRKRF